MPAIFPTEAEPSQEDVLKTLFGRLSRGESDRRKSQALRWRMLNGGWGKDIHAKVGDIHDSPSFAREVRKFVSESANLPSVVVKTLAVTYKMGVRRRVKADRRSEEALHKFYKESGWNEDAPEVNRTSFLCGPTLVVPWVTKAGAGRTYVVPPHCLEVFQDPTDPLHGDPLGAMWKLTEDPTAIEQFAYLDRDWYLVLDGNGRLVRETMHGAGIFPGELFRAYRATDDDFWSLEKMRFVADAGLLVGYFFARLNMRRKQQDAKAPTVTGDPADMPTGQAIIGGEKPLTFEVGSGQQVEFSVHDLNLSPESALKHIKSIIELTVEQFGIPQSSVTFDTKGEAADISLHVSNDRLSHIRGDQLPFYRRSELSLSAKTAIIMQRLGHRLRFDVDPSSIADGFETEFPDLNRMGDPKTVTQLEDWELGHMLIDEVDLVMRRNPEMTRREAEEHFRKKLEFRAGVAKELAQRNLVLDASKGMLSTPQAFGRMGGRPQTESDDEVIDDDDTADANE